MSIACFHDEVSSQKSIKKALKMNSIYPSFQRFIGASKCASIIIEIVYHKDLSWHLSNTTNIQNIARTSFDINRSFQINIMYQLVEYLL